MSDAWDNPADAPGGTARQLVRSLDRASLATALAGSDSYPYASLVMVALDHDASPILLLSDLADHSRNLASDPRASLLFDGTVGRAEPLTGARVSVQGRIAESSEPRHRMRFLARHPSAEGYAGFKDFRIYHMAVERAHLVAGFGRIDWIDAGDLLYAGADSELMGQEDGIVAHMNEDHGDANDLYAARLLGRDGAGWRMTGVDPEGCDLRLGGNVARLPFARPISNAESVRAELVELARKARDSRASGAKT